MKWLVAACVSVMTMLAGTIAAAAATDPYLAGSAGYDAGPGNCSGTPPSAQFAILDATGGRPFTTNSCLSQEAAAAGSAQVSLYFNTGYVGAYGRDVTSACKAAASAAGYTGKAGQAYAIGCSEADYAVSAAGSIVPAAWWLDVETGNSWSSSSGALNVDAIQGAVNEAHSRSGSPVGVYSTASMWQTITRGGTVTGVDASWVPSSSCAVAGFEGSPVWLIQGQASGGFDTDTAC